MPKLACEICGSDLVKDEGVFVCQGCGAKYTLEEARQLAFASTGTASAPEQPPHHQGHPGGPATSPADVNNYVCKMWTGLVKEYKELEHPTQEQHAAMIERAKECLAALETAAGTMPGEVAALALIYGNCKEIVDDAEDLKYHVPKEPDGWDKKGLGPFERIEIPSQSKSWDAKYDEQYDILTAEYLELNPASAAEREELKTHEAALEEQLAELKDEKKGKGFFNFDAKREVKERMAPVKEELARVRSLIRDIDKAAERHADERIKALGVQFTILD